LSWNSWEVEQAAVGRVVVVVVALSTSGDCCSLAETVVVWPGLQFSTKTVAVLLMMKLS
jgi:hypothetical protein